MRFFPQLSSGAGGQFPLRRRQVRRTVVNETEDGRRIKLADDAAGSTEWDLVFAGLKGSEAAAMEQFFAGGEGLLGSFTFLDPAANLLAWSEKLDDAAWQPAPLLQIAGGIADPLGTQRATSLVNPTGAALKIEQVLNAPEWFVYALSVYARSSGGSRLRLVRSSGSSSEGAVKELTTQWQRHVLPGKFTGTGETVRFALEVEAGGSVEVFGVQVEAQPGASGYKRTFSRGGVYPNSRFGQDDIEITAEGVNWSSMRVAIVALG
jgi:hypothetical protein